MKLISGTGRPLHRIVAIVDSDSSPFEIGLTWQILTAATLKTSSTAYEFRLCSADRAQVDASGLFRPSSVHDIAIAEEADTVLPSLPSCREAPAPQ